MELDWKISGLGQTFSHFQVAGEVWSRLRELGLPDKIVLIGEHKVYLSDPHTQDDTSLYNRA